MENYNIELLNETYNRVVNFLEKNSNLKIFISGDVNNINSDFSEIYISKERSYALIFRASLTSTEEYNKYAFLLWHKYNDYAQYIGSSIFEYAERCRIWYNNIKFGINNSIAYELYSSDAGRIIKELGFPSCLEELAMKMDLMGI